MPAPFCSDPMTGTSETFIQAWPTEMSSSDVKLDPRVLGISLRDYEINEIELRGVSAHEGSGLSKEEESEPYKIDLISSQCKDLILFSEGRSPWCSFARVRKAYPKFAVMAFAIWAGEMAEDCGILEANIASVYFLVGSRFGRPIQHAQLDCQG